MSGSMGKWCVAALAVAVTAGALVVPGTAQARRSSVTVDIGIGAVVPLFHRPYHRHYYPPPPPVYYGPPPVVYAPPPPVVYAPQPGISADPAGPTYMSRSGHLCREYRTTIIVEGRPQPAFGTACQMPDGSWQVVN